MGETIKAEQRMGVGNGILDTATRYGFQTAIIEPSPLLIQLFIIHNTYSLSEKKTLDILSKLYKVTFNLFRVLRLMTLIHDVHSSERLRSFPHSIPVITLGSRF